MSAEPDPRDSKSPAAKPPERGLRWAGDDPTERAAVIEHAFDYRGDVTLCLEGGEEVEGYLFNRDRDGDPPTVQLMLPAGGPPRTIAYDEIRAVVFSGKDAASGKSWESWVRKWKAKKEAEARGEKREVIGLFPEEGES